MAPEVAGSNPVIHPTQLILRENQSAPPVYHGRVAAACRGPETLGDRSNAPWPACGARLLSGEMIFGQSLSLGVVVQSIRRIHRRTVARRVDPRAAGSSRQPRRLSSGEERLIEGAKVRASLCDGHQSGFAVDVVDSCILPSNSFPKPARRARADGPLLQQPNYAGLLEVRSNRTRSGT